MALRYLTLKEPQYVPSYNTLDMNVVNTVDSDIQRQGEIAQQYKIEQMDMLREGINESLSGLDPQDQEYADRVLREEQQAISDYVDQHGARRSLDYVGQRVNKFKNRTSPLFKKAGATQQLNEKLEESKAPGYLKSQILSNVGDIEYDEETGEAVGFNSAIDQNKVETLANWQDLDKWIQDFNQGWKASSRETSSYRNLPEGEVQYYKESLKGLGFENVNATTVAAMLNNPQIRNQLQLEAEAAIENAPEGSNIKRTSDGGVETVIATPRKNENGEFLDKDGNVVRSASQAEMIKERKTFESPAKWQAIMKATPYSTQESFVDYSYEIKAPESIGGKDEKDSNTTGASSRWQASFSQSIDSMEAPKWWKQTAQEFKNYENQSQSVLETANGIVPPSKNITVLPNKENGGFKIGTDDQVYTNLEDALENDVISRGTYNSLKTQEGIRQSVVRQKSALEHDMKGLENNVFNQISKQSGVDSELLDAFSINDKGEVVVNDDKILGLEAGQLRNFDVEDNTRWITDSSDKRTIQSLREGESTTVKVGERTSRTGTINEKELVITNKGGEIKYLDKSSPEINSLKSKIEKEYQKEVDDLRGVGNKPLNAWTLNLEDNTSSSLDKRLIELFKSGLTPGTIQGQGDLVNNRGEALTMDDNQEFAPPYKILFNRNGKASIVGTVQDKNTEEPHHKNVMFTGTFVESALRDLLPEQYQIVSGTKMLSTYFPRVLNKEQESVTLQPIDLVQMGIHNEGNPTINQPVKITYRKYRKSDGDAYLFDIIDPNTGENIGNAHTMDELYLSLANLESGQ